MIVLDTNVLSAFMSRDVDARLVAWLDAQPAESIWTTSITIFEIRLGIQILAPGRRRQQLEVALSRSIAEDLEDRILPFDAPAAEAASTIAARRRRAGRPVEVRDVQIGGIVLARRAALATRNTRDFEGVGVEIIDPLAASSR